MVVPLQKKCGWGRTTRRLRLQKVIGFAWGVIHLAMQEGTCRIRKDPYKPLEKY